MEVKSIRRNGSSPFWLQAVLLGLWALFVPAVPGWAQVPHYCVAVLTSGGDAFSPAQEGLAQLGYHEGKNIALKVEDVQGDLASLPSRAATIVEAKPDVIFTVGTGATAAAKQATTTIPIVFAFVADPLRSALIDSYASSKNNLTGVSNYAGPLSGKRLEILQEVAPGIERVLALVPPQQSVAEVSFQFLAEAAPKLGIELLRRDVTNKEVLEQVLKALPSGAVDAIYHVPSGLVGPHIDLLIDKAMQDRIPLATTDFSMVERGALMSYGADLRLLGMQAAKLMAKVINGVKPAELPVQTPEQLFLAINLVTAMSIGLNIPHSILERTDRVVE
jgi:putative ABC transport system substrate-binding protein